MWMLVVFALDVSCMFVRSILESSGGGSESVERIEWN